MPVTRSTCERYDIRGEKGFGWAVIVIDERSGLFSVVSDYGEYGFLWGNHGRKSLKHFLVEIAADPQYLMGKLGRRNYVKQEETKKEFRRVIIEARQEMNISREQARDAWYCVEVLDFADHIELHNALESELAPVFPDCDLPIARDFSPQLRCFTEKVYPVFVEELARQIEEQKDKSDERE